MATYYDQQHQPIELRDRAYLRVVRRGRHGYSLPENNAIAPIRVGPFEIIERVGPLAYRLRLPPRYAGIHPVISIAHLERYPGPDPYNRQLPPPPPTLVDGVEQDEAEEIIDDEIRNGVHMMKMRWTDNTETWEPRDNLLQDSPFLVRHYEARQRDQRQRRRLERDQDQ